MPLVLWALLCALVGGSLRASWSDGGTITDTEAFIKSCYDEVDSLRALTRELSSAFTDEARTAAAGTTETSFLAALELERETTRHLGSEEHSGYASEERVDLCADMRQHTTDRHGNYRPALPYFRNTGIMCAGDQFVKRTYLQEGHYGCVYKATHAPTGRVVALKMLQTQRDPFENFAFRSEECLQRRLDRHPSFPKHYCTFVDGHGTVFIAMELISGIDVFDHIHTKRSSGRFKHKYGMSSVAEIAASIIGAMRFMHLRGVVFRDMKPENLMLDRRRRLKVIDFGLAADPDNQLEGNWNCLVGTWQYFAPENYLPKPRRPAYISFQNDWWAVGMTIYEIGMRDGGPYPQEVKTDSEVIKHIERGFTCDPGEQAELVDFCDLINQLCNRDWRDRLGHKDGSDELFLLHPFLAKTSIKDRLEDAHHYAGKKRR